MPHFSGSALYARVIWGTSDGVLSGTVTVTGDQRSLGWNEDTDKAETTAGSDAAKSFVNTVRDTQIDLTLLDNGASGSALYQALSVGYWGTIEFGHLGSATGSPKYSCKYFVESLDTEYPYKDEVERNYTLQRSGDWITHWERAGSTW